VTKAVTIYRPSLACRSLCAAPSQRHYQADFDLLIDLLKSNGHQIPAFTYAVIGEMSF
jgi:hypothetical protein